MDYPWYHWVRGVDLKQGDLLEKCPVFLPQASDDEMITFDEEARDVIVLTQSCDLVPGRERVTEVLLCPVWERSQYVPPHHLCTARGMEEARRGTLPAYHLLGTN